MGGKPAFSGVEVHGNHVRIVFNYQGKRCREALKGMPPTPQTMRYAVRLRVLKVTGAWVKIYALDGMSHDEISNLLKHPRSQPPQ